MSTISRFLFGNPEKYQQLSTQTPQQQAFLNNYLQGLQQQGQPGGAYSQSQQYLQGLLSGDPSSYNRFAAPYINQFEQQTLPRLAERFAGLGGGLGGGIGNSSGFGQAIGGAGAQFQSNLMGLFEQLRQQAAQQAMGNYNQQAGLGLGTRSFENVYQPGTPGFLATALGLAGQGISQGIGQGAGYAAFAL